MNKNTYTVSGTAPRKKCRAFELFSIEYNFRPKTVSSKINYKRNEKHRNKGIDNPC